MATSQRPSTALAVVDDSSALETLRARREITIFVQHEAELRAAARGQPLDRIYGEILMAVQRNASITKCSPVSIVSATARAIATGLPIGDKVHLVPYGRDLTMVLDYKGAIELVVAAGGARMIDAKWVYDDDAFDYQEGSAAYVKHKRAISARDGHRIVAGYAVAYINNYLPPKIVVMGVDEINKIRAKSQTWAKKSLEEIPWYAAKTCVKQIVKQLPTTPAMRAVAQTFESEEEIVEGEYEVALPEGGEEPGAGAGAPADTGASASDDSGVGAQVPDADGAVHEEGDGRQHVPNCPKCGKAMRDDRVTKTNVKAPDFRCVARIGTDNEGFALFCDGLYWPGQWPPKPLATDDQRAEIGRLAKEAERAGVDGRTISSVNKANAKADLKAYRADEIIAGLKERIAEKQTEAGGQPARDPYVDKDPGLKELF